jgi:alkylation response protein AidB-like acyl-CoA dehydrogenase
MPAPVVRGPLRRVLLGRLAWQADGTAADGTGPGGATADHGLLARDVALLRESGYLKLAVPAHLGGEGLNLRQVACAQRQLAARAPAAALAVTAHHARVGAAADTLASAPGDVAGPAMERLLSAAAQGRFFAGCGPEGLRGLTGDPADEVFVAGMFGWGLPLAGMTFYAIARQAFDLAVHRARWPGGDQTGGDHASGGHEPGHPLDRWPVAEAALRLDAIRGQLDEVIGGWQRRTAAGGALTSLDPGGQWLIRLFTVRHAAAEGAQRVIELAAQITEPAGTARPLGLAGLSGYLRSTDGSVSRAGGSAPGRAA